jgi:hypothetical protein
MKKTKSTNTKPKKIRQNERQEEPTPQELNAMVLGPVLEQLDRAPAQTSVELDHGERWKLTKGGILVVRDHYSVLPERDPEQNPAWKSKERRKYTSQAAWDREQEIVDEAGGGELVFADTLVSFWDKIVIKDHGWRPDPDWRVDGGFDHGKTNATALLRCYHDFEGTIIFAGEYYQPGREIWQNAPAFKKMVDFKRMDPVFCDPSIFPQTLQQAQRPGEAVARAKSFYELYEEQGIDNFVSFAEDRSDVSFAGRLQMHWADLEHREPSVKIFCPEGMYTETPQVGLHNWGCPNLLWELMRARRVKLTAQQLLSRNTSEAIIDKDNHARDAMKYVLMSHPEPSRKTLERRVNERLAALTKADPTVAAAQYHKIVAEEKEEEEDQPSYYGGGARRRFAMMRRRRGGR